MTDSIEQRRAPRYPAHWPATIVIDTSTGQHTYRGVTCDLSMSGIAILTERKVPSGVKVNVSLSVPPDHEGGSQPLFQLKAYVAYSILTTEHQQFRCGMSIISSTETMRATLKPLVERAR